MNRYVVTLSRMDVRADPEAGALFGCSLVVVGPFRSRARADKRAATIRRLAETYEDPEGVTGPDNALSVIVEPLERGTLSARDTLAALYEAL